MLALVPGPADFDSYTVAVWCCALMMMAGFIMLAWMLALEEIRWRRRWREVVRAEWPAPRGTAKPAPRTMEEYLESIPHVRFYFGPDYRVPPGRRVLSLAMGKNWGARDGDCAYRFWLDVYIARGWTHRTLFGPFVDSSGWTGRETIPPCDFYRPESPRTLRIHWGFIA